MKGDYNEIQVGSPLKLFKSKIGYNESDERWPDKTPVVMIVCVSWMKMFGDLESSHYIHFIQLPCFQRKESLEMYLIL